ncbi:MAG: ABC transporter permease [Candidatus Onthoplasma sp.]
MFKIISSEMKKILSKSGIYILSVFLAIILVAGVAIYKPETYESNVVKIEGTTFAQKYEYFMGGLNAGPKSKADDVLQNALDKINNYFIDGETEKQHIENLITNFYSAYDLYLSSKTSEDNAVVSNKRNALKTAFQDICDEIDNVMIKSSNGTFSALLTSKNRDAWSTLSSNMRKWLNKTITYDKVSDDCKYFEDNFKNQFDSLLSSIIYPELSTSFVSTYTSSSEGKYKTLKERLNTILTTMSSLKSEPQATDDNEIAFANKMNELANEYISQIDTFANLISYELLCNAFDHVSTSENMTIVNLSNYSKYDSNTLKVRYSYLFDNNKTEQDFAHPLTIGVTSNTKTNAYDFAYFVLKIFSFVIIVYAILLCCHSIAGEIKEGSMRYIAIRPMSRSEIYFGKLLSIIIISTILLVFSAIISFLVGCAVYGVSSLPILTIFNGKTAVVMKPMAMYFIAILSILLQIIVYSSIALLFSSFIKSDLASMTILILLYLVNTLLPLFVTKPNSWLTFYPFSHIDLFALFGSSTYAVAGNIFNSLFGTKIYTTTSIGLTIVMILLIVGITNAVGNVLFKKKEL